MSKKFFFMAELLRGDGHTRITKSDDGIVIGGSSAEDHERFADCILESNEIFKKNANNGIDYALQKVREFLNEKAQ